MKFRLVAALVEVKADMVVEVVVVEVRVLAADVARREHVPIAA